MPQALIRILPDTPCYWRRSCERRPVIHHWGCNLQHQRSGLEGSRRAPFATEIFESCQPQQYCLPLRWRKQGAFQISPCLAALSRSVLRDRHFVSREISPCKYCSKWPLCSFCSLSVALPCILRNIQNKKTTWTLRITCKNKVQVQRLKYEFDYEVTLPEK